MPARRMKLGLPAGGAGHAHDQRQVADQAVADPEDDRPQRPRPAAGPVPRLAPADLGRRCARRARSRRRRGSGRWPRRSTVAGLEPLPDLRVLALVGGDRRDLGRRALGVVRSSSSPSSALTRSATAAVPNSRATRMMNRTRIRGPVGRRHVRAELAQLRRPDVGVAALVAGDPLERGGAARVLLDRATARRTGRSRRAPASGCRGSARRRWGARRHRRPSSPRRLAACHGRRHRSAAAALPLGGRRRRGDAALDERLALAERTMTALVAGCRAAAQDRRPPAAGRLVRPRDAGLPARRRRRRSRRPARHEVGRRASRRTTSAGLPAINAVVVLNDPATGCADRDPRRRADHGRPDRGGLRRRDPALRPDRDGAGATGGAHRRRRPGPQPPRRSSGASCRVSR